jgi:hypothetical protein
MKQRIRKPKPLLLLVPYLFLFVLVALSSFSAKRFTDDFLKQLGITKAGADEKIANGILGGYIDIYGVKNAKNIVTDNRKAVTLDLLTYTKQYLNSPAFVKQYNQLRVSNKPQQATAETPEALKTKNIEASKKFVVEAEAMVKKADPKFKSIFEKNVEEARKRLKEAEDPNNRQYVLYTKNYPKLVSDMERGNTAALADWNNRYPENHLLFIKKRLAEFLEVTKDVDFAAELKERNGRKVFVNPDYERKDSRWKMAFRAGREVVVPARDFVQKWLSEIN